MHKGGCHLIKCMHGSTPCWSRIITGQGYPRNGSHSGMYYVCMYACMSMYFLICLYLSFTLSNKNRNVTPRTNALFRHFYNVPVTGNQTTENSIISFVKNLARSEDFVSLKLDIDSPLIEIQAALDILQQPDIASLIDEFFFELHFRCDIMRDCGWGDKMRGQFLGLTLDRPRVMEFFQDLRKKGVRAHIWP